MMKQVQLFGVILLSLILLSGCVAVNKRSKDPDKAAQIYADLGLQYLRQGKLDLALTKLENSLEIDSKQPQANHYIAEVYKELGDRETADEYYNKALKYDAENPMLLNNYGAFLCGEGRIDAAEEYFNRAAEVPRYRNPELVYENLALCALQNGSMEKAEKYFRKALSSQPKLPKSLFQMAALSYEQNKFLNARAFIQRFHALGRTEQSLKLAIKIEQALDDTAAVERLQQTLREQSFQLKSDQ